MIAVKEGFVRIAHMLVEAEADVNAVSSPLQFCVLKRNSNQLVSYRCVILPPLAARRIEFLSVNVGDGCENSGGA